MGIFRYPGGKSKLLEPIKELLYPMIKDSYSECFVGGGSVLIQAAKDFPKIKLYINDKDEEIYSFWKMMISSDYKIKKFYKLVNQKPTVKLFEQLKSENSNNEIDKAYCALFFNRCCFSGIRTSGPIGGYEQKSKWTIDCRYNSVRLIKEIDELRNLFKDRLIVTNLDFSDFLKTSNGVIYLDPPYYKKGDMLYPQKMDEMAHKQLSDILKLKNNWLLSYDVCPEIKNLYNWANLHYLDANYSINGEKKKWNNQKEFLITK